jgi:tetratricopeptide (TPR) repeat protein
LLCNWHVEVERERTSLRHRIVQQLSCRFELDIPIALVGVARDKPADERNAWDLYYLALPKIYSAEGYSAEDALALIDGALDLDPNIGPALCAGAWVRSTHADHNTTSADRAAAATLARRAVELCQDDAFVMGWAAICIAALDQDLETARDICQRAITFNPFSSMALIANGVVDHYLGDDAGALAWIQRAETGVDTEPLTFLSYAVRSMANFQLGNNEAAIEWGRRSVGRNPRFVLAQRSLTAALAETGRLEEARESAQRLVELDLSEHLSFFRQRSPYKHRRATENLYRALARAGLPEQRA